MISSLLLEEKDLIFLSFVWCIGGWRIVSSQSETSNMKKHKNVHPKSSRPCFDAFSIPHSIHHHSFSVVDQITVLLLL